MKTQIKKEFHVPAPIEQVWKSLADPTDVVTCVPGASITDKIDDANYKGAVVTKFGPIKASYAGDIEIVELDEANKQMTLKGRGLDSKGKGSADMLMVGKLAEKDGGTQVDFSMDITIIGMLAQFGSRLINDVSDQLLNQFVDNFKAKLASAAPAPASSPTAAAASASAPVTVSDTNTSTAGASDASVTVQPVENTRPATVESSAAPAKQDDNALNAGSLAGTVVKSIFGSIIDFFKRLFGGKKS